MMFIRMITRFCIQIFLFSFALVHKGRKRNIVYNPKIYKIYKILETIISSVFIIIHIVYTIMKYQNINERFLTRYIFAHYCLFLIIHTVFYILGRINIYLDIEKRIIENELLYKTPEEIKRFLLQNYNKIYTIKEIEKTLKRIFRRYK